MTIFRKSNSGTWTRLPRWYLGGKMVSSLISRTQIGLKHNIFTLDSHQLLTIKCMFVSIHWINLPHIITFFAHSAAFYCPHANNQRKEEKSASIDVRSTGTLTEADCWEIGLLIFCHQLPFFKNLAKGE